MPKLLGTPLLLTAILALTAEPGCGPSTAMLGSYSDAGQSSGGQTSTSIAAAGGAASGGTSTLVGLPLFDTAMPIDILYVAGKTTTDPAIRGDGLELFFMSTRSGNKSIWRSERTSTTVDWEAAALVEPLNSDAEEQNPRLSEDGLRIWFYTGRDRNQGTIWESTRASTSELFEAPLAVLGVSSADTSDVSAGFNQAATIAIVSTLVSSKTGYELIEWRRGATTEGFTNGVSLTTVNSAVDDFDPWLSSDGLTLVFHSYRTGNNDLFWTSRPTVDDDFATPIPISELNSTAGDTAPSLTADRRRIVFASTRDGDERLYEAVAVE